MKRRTGDTWQAKSNNCQDAWGYQVQEATPDARGIRVPIKVLEGSAPKAACSKGFGMGEIFLVCETSPQAVAEQADVVEVSDAKAANVSKGMTIMAHIIHTAACKRNCPCCP